MSLLSIEHVRLADADSPGRLLLDDVSLELHTGELVAVWGKRRSGRSTLLRLACGLILPDEGVVRFDERQLRGPTAIGAGIAYCTDSFRIGEAWPVERELVEVQLGRGIPRRRARRSAQEALQRTGAEHLQASLLRTLRGAERVRVMLALALTSAPRLLLIDDVVAGVELVERRAIMALLRSLADEGLAVLTCTDETPALAGTDRALTLSEGRLHGRAAPELAEIVPLRRSASA
ncbi:MAG TPA: ATP-binding cassette domain-containing protein [Solirubrobacteraceae bacterium]